MFDVITIGSATVDVFIKSKSKQIDIERVHGHEHRDPEQPPGGEGFCPGLPGYVTLEVVQGPPPA